jgi:hypothetical protein
LLTGADRPTVRSTSCSFIAWFCCLGILIHTIHNTAAMAATGSRTARNRINGDVR